MSRTRERITANEYRRVARSDDAFWFLAGAIKVVMNADPEALNQAMENVALQHGIEGFYADES